MPKIPRQVHGPDLENLKASGLTDATIRENGLWTATPSDGDKIVKILNCGRGANACLGGLVFPYRDLDGHTNGFACLRSHTPRQRDGKPIKYEQPKGEPPRAYFPVASLPLLRDREEDIYVTEGPKKALALAQIGAAAIGISGVDCGTKNGELIADLAAIDWKDRKVGIVFDWDPKPETRDNVNRAAERLAKALKAAGAEEVYRVLLPPGLDGAKQGVDDFLVAAGKKAKKDFADLVNEADPVLDDGPQPDSLTGRMVLFHTPDNEAYAEIKVGEHCENWPIRSPRFGMFVRRHFYETSGDTLSKSQLDKILDHCEAEAIFGGDEREVYLRIAGYDGKIYVDLGNREWQAVEVDANGWRVLDRSPVPFRRPKGFGALPVPVEGGNVEELARFTNVAEDDWPLVLACITFWFRPTGPYCVLKIRGEQGSGKSSTILVFRKLIDPSVAPARTKPPGERELAIAVDNSWLYVVDNLSFLGPELSDALCRLATTGIGFCTRRLYTNTDEIQINAVRPVVLAGIEDVGSRSDLLDRSVTVELPSIPDDERRDESQFWLEFEEAQPRILGALLTAVSAGMRKLPEVKLDRLPRMADFMRWAAAVEEALGFDVGTCEAAYERNRAEAHVTVVEESLIAAAMIRFVQFNNLKNWEGTATELLAELKARYATDPQASRDKAWPNGARALSAQLSRLSPNLRHVGISISRGSRGRGDDRRRTIIVRVDPDRVPPMSEQDQHVKDLADDARRRTGR